MTPPRYIKAFALSGFILSALPDSGAINMAETNHLRSWFRENHLFVEEQIRFLNLPIKSDFDPQTVWYIERYLRHGQAETERMLGRAAYYLPMFERELRANGLPEALKYLPVVESGLEADVTSPVGAGGLWQFMPATARHFKLQVNHLVDERRDPYRSTAAAIQLLDLLYREFEDWDLVLAAYNCGPGRVWQAMAKARSRQYARIRRFLPEQTQSYISKFKAVAYVSAFYEFFGLEASAPAYLEGEKVRLTVTRQTSFGELSRLCNLPAPVLRSLNPAYLQGVIPGGRLAYKLVVPAEAEPVLSAAGLVVREAGEDPERRAAESGVEQAADGRVVQAQEDLASGKADTDDEDGYPEKSHSGAKKEWQITVPPSSEKQSKGSKLQEILAVWYKRQGLKAVAR